MTLDPRALADMLAMVGDDPAFVGEIVDTYLEDAPAQLDGMRGAIATGDTAELARHAHTLKGNSRNVGATALADLARELEEAARTGTVPPDAGARVAAAAAELERVRASLDAARARDWQP